MISNPMYKKYSSHCSILPLIIGLLFTTSLSAQQIQFSLSNTPIPEALRQLSAASNINIAFSERFFSTGTVVSLPPNTYDIETALDKILADQQVGFRRSAGSIILYKKEPPRHTISGFLTDADSGERLIYANVTTDQGLGTTTNEYGFFSMTVPEGDMKLGFSYVGYQRVEEEVSLDKNMKIHPRLQPSVMLKEVIVTPEVAAPSALLPTGLSTLQFVPEKGYSVPDIGGEADIVRMAALMPGVQSGADGFGGLHIRGGSADQNLMLLDGVPVYHAGHLLNMFSIYNTHTIKSTRLLKGAIPARYGGRLSSVFDVRTREGNMQRYSSEAEASLVSGKLSLEGPLIKEKGALLVSGRSSYIGYVDGGLFVPLLIPGNVNESPGEEIELKFSDLNVKANYNFGNDRFYLSWYSGRDYFKDEVFEEEEEEERTETMASEAAWGNRVFSLRWNRLINDKLFSNTTLTYSNYNYNYELLIEDFEEDDYYYIGQSSDIRDVSFNSDFDFRPSPVMKWAFGGGWIHHTLTPDDVYLEDDEDDPEENDDFELTDFEESLDGGESFTGNEIFAYVENEYRLTPNTKIAAGLRLSSYWSDELQTVFPEPRLFLSQKLLPNLTATASTGRMIQYLHRASTSNLNLPDSKWLPPAEDLRPEKSWQHTLGLEYSPADQWTLSTELYYKTMHNLVLFDLAATQGQEEEYYLGEGKSKGWEIMLMKKGATGGNINYTLSRSDRRFDDFNAGESFPFQFDHRHNIKLHLFHQFTPRWKADMTWTYASGQPYIVVFDNEVIDDQSVDLPGVIESASLLYQRAKPVHQLNLGLHYTLEKGKFTHSFKMGVYNLYNRRNDHYFRLQSENQQFVTKGVSILGILPAVSYRVKFN